MNQIRDWFWDAGQSQSNAANASADQAEAPHFLTQPPCACARATHSDLTQAIVNCNTAVLALYGWYQKSDTLDWTVGAASVRMAACAAYIAETSLVWFHPLWPTSFQWGHNELFFFFEHYITKLCVAPVQPP